MTYSGIDPWVGKWGKRWDLITRTIGIKNGLYSWSSYLRMGVSISLLRKILVICGYIWQQYDIYIYVYIILGNYNFMGMWLEYHGNILGDMLETVASPSEPCMISRSDADLFRAYHGSPHLTSGYIQLQLIHLHHVVLRCHMGFHPVDLCITGKPRGLVGLCISRGTSLMFAFTECHRLPLASNPAAWCSSVVFTVPSRFPSSKMITDFHG